MATFTRYLQAATPPRKEFAPIPPGQALYIPGDADFRTKPTYAELMKRVYGEASAPKLFASMYVEGNNYLRARIAISKAHEVLVLDNLENKREGQQGYLKLKHLVAHCLNVLGVNPASINFILITNIDNKNTKDMITTYQNAEYWQPGQWLCPTTAGHRNPVLTSVLGRTARSVAGQLGKLVGNIWVGQISGQPALGFSLVTSRPATPVTPAPSRPGTPRPAVPRAPTPVVRKSTCGCIIC